MQKFGEGRLCKEEYKRSIACLEKNQEKRDNCQEFFDVYKACKKEESKQRKAAMNAKYPVPKVLEEMFPTLNSFIKRQ